MLKKPPENYLNSNTRTRSQMLYERALKFIPGGVNSPVRAFRAVGGHPLFIARGRGSKIYDADGVDYIDYVCSWGPLILGHSHPKMISALSKALRKGTSYGAPTESEIELAELICKAMPSIERVRLVSSGTEATMTAIRLARAFTGRDTVIKFDGCYHGHVDGLLVRSGSGVATLGLPDSPGVPADIAAKTISLPFNDIHSVEETMDKRKGEIACIIVEPIAGNMGVVLPKEGYLQALRKITAENGIVLIFDEVITGFRVGYGGAQQLYDIKPDLTCLGKIIGGGLPVGAYGGRKEIMSLVAPAGPMYQAGTLSGNPLAVAAGITALKMLRQRAVYQRLERITASLCDGISQAAARSGVKITINRVGSMFTTFFTDHDVYDYPTAKTSNTDLYRRYFWRMLNEGIYLAPSQFEAGFVSLAHTKRDIDRTVQAAAHAFERMKDEK